MDKKTKKKANIKISGMSCASCALNVEKSLEKMEGVNEAHVNLGTEEATVEYDSEKLGLNQLEDAVEDAGYGVVNEKVTIKVGGMSCAMCVKAIEDVMGKLDGVSSVNVNLASEKAYVTYNPRMVTVADMRDAINDLGYQYLGIEGEETEDLEEKLRLEDLNGKRNRIIVGFGFSIPLMVLMYSNIMLPIPMSEFMLIVSIVPFIYVSYPIFKAAYRALRNRNLDMDVMYSMGIGVAFVSSVLGTFSIVLTPEFMFYETALMLAAFLMMGRWLETRAKGNTSTAIKKLIGMQPKTATIIRKGSEVQIPIEDVEVKDTVVVKPGERIPADGEVVEGESYVDESAITGEPLPVFKKDGSKVVGGTINKNGVLKFKALKIGRDTVLSQIIKLVETAQGSKPPVQRIADRAVTYFIPTVLTTAVVAFVVWYVLLGSTLLFGLTVLISILVVACPCALGLATPTAVTVGIGRGAELGILVKNGESLEVSEKLTTILFDKTGTLTKGKPEVTDVLGIGVDEDSILQFAASVENNSEHPLGDAVVKKARERGRDIFKTKEFDSFGGKGVKAIVDDEGHSKTVFVGNRALFKEQKIPLDKKIEAEILKIENNGKTAVLIGINSEMEGIIGIADTLKEGTVAAIGELKRMGLKVAMITGDNQRTADAIAKQVGIDVVIAEVLPQDKAVQVKSLQDEGEVVGFVGDGINDAPALAQADVGIAIGSGTDVAIESGDIVLIKDDLQDSVAGLQLSRKVMGRIKLNLFWAFAYNVVLIPVAAGALYPAFGITFRPEYAGLAMALSSVTVVSLSLLLKGYVPPVKSLKKS
ncbi:heavy metal translocating P-type ATPase [Methanobacterium congolense]|uniref:P-type Cu(+) transporter n=1 Tax=Methanobacterium congolense TaxID=118062 RepID=A0A1D3KZH1_9EURY|nr:heavy metal translocating P-type ATPase [Methanobacterium congolense]SCG84683.1 Copper-exporting P-type ATPase A [Methanobacterium congolense]